MYVVEISILEHVGDLSPFGCRGGKVLSDEVVTSTASTCSTFNQKEWTEENPGTHQAHISSGQSIYHVSFYMRPTLFSPLPRYSPHSLLAIDNEKRPSPSPEEETHAHSALFQIDLPVQVSAVRGKTAPAGPLSPSWIFQRHKNGFRTLHSVQNPRPIPPPPPPPPSLKIQTIRMEVPTICRKPSPLRSLACHALPCQQELQQSKAQ